MIFRVGPAETGQAATDRSSGRPMRTKPCPFGWDRRGLGSQEVRLLAGRSGSVNPTPETKREFFVVSEYQ